MDRMEEVVPQAKSHAEAVHAVKQAVLQIQLFLLDGVKSKAQLQASSSLLTQSEYGDVVTERSIAHQCGYPLCEKLLPTEKHRKGRYRISLHEHKVYDLQETGLYCSSSCLVASKTFAGSLQVERDGLIELRKLATVVSSVRESKLSKKNHKKKKSKERKIHSKSDSILSEVKERHDSAIASFEDAGPFDSIEGYTPLTSIREWRSRDNLNQSASSTGLESEVIPLGDVDDVDEANSAANAILLSSSNSTIISSAVYSDKGKSSLILEGRKKNQVQQGVTVLKSVLKKGNTESASKRTVSWGDQKVKQRTGTDTKAKKEVKIREMPQLLKIKSTAAKEKLPRVLEITSAAAKSSTFGTFVSLPSSDSSAGKTDSAESATDAESQRSEIISTSEASDTAESKVFSVESCTDAEVQIAESLPEAERPETAESRSDCTESSTDAERQIAERLKSAEALAAALTAAAEATAAGEFESNEAVARAGISILSINETQEESVSSASGGDQPKVAITGHEEMATKSGESSKIGVQWPKIEPEEEEEEEVSTSRNVWHDVAPKNFKVELSGFGTMWLALEEWISAATIAHIYGKEPHDEEEFLAANGREYRWQVVCEGGLSTEISKIFSNSIARALPEIVQTLRLPIPVSVLEQALGRLVRTMSFVEAIPAFGVSEWRMIVMLLLDGLSVNQVASLRAHLVDNMGLFRKVLDSTGTSEAEYDTFRDLLLPLERKLSLSSLSGG